MKVVAVEGVKLAEEIRFEVQNDILEILKSKRKKGEDSLVIVHEKTAVELVREGRGE